MKIKIKVLTRLHSPFEGYALQNWDNKNYCKEYLEKIDNKIYNVRWINK